MIRLIAFRITNFRSIVDSGWCSFSSDGATVIVGQNESGKSSILEGLSKTLAPVDISDDDCRIDADLPAIFLRVKVVVKDLLARLAGYPAAQLKALEKYLAKNDDTLTVSYRWVHVATKEKFECNMECEDDVLAASLESASPQPVAAGEQDANEGEEEQGEKDEVAPDQSNLTSSLLADAIYDEAPSTVLFDQGSGLLPDRVTIQKKGDEWALVGPGAAAAENFLSIANVNLKALVEGSPRGRQTALARANAAVTEDFGRLWSQTIGKKEKLQLKCEFAYYDSSSPNPGAPHLEFWIVDGLNQLFPKQRSLGVRWFISFYLQLKASEKDTEGTVFLLDEPGANLHSKAQADVLKLINQLGASNKRQIVYTTHSPHMIEYDKLYRVLAAQRDGEADNTPTRIIHAHELALHPETLYQPS
jgi:hypothetical protein